MVWRTLPSAVLLVFLFYPVQIHAGVISIIADKIKAIVTGSDLAGDNHDDSDNQNISVLKPVVFDDDTINKGYVSNDLKDTDTLSATVGSLRLSNEDIIFPTNDTISIYEVKKGDTIASIAKVFNISKNTILWANDIKGNTITPGDTLVILPVTGIKHTIKNGDTVTSIAKRYRADIDDIAKYNGIAKDADLVTGETIIVPEGEIQLTQPTSITRSSKTKLQTAPLGFFVRPLANYVKTQGIHGHNGVDLAAKSGTPIVAVASGRVIVARTGGYNGGYGNMIVIAHENNIQTLYSHLREIYVSPGMAVTQGQVIGAVGSTGRSTGPHLHIEVRGAANPF